MAKKIEEKIEEVSNVNNIDVITLENEELKQDNAQKIERINELEQEINSLLIKYTILEKELKQSTNENENNITFIQTMKDKINSMKEEYKSNDKIVLNEVSYKKGDNVYVLKYGNQVFNIINQVGYTNDGDILYSLYDSLNLIEIDAYPQSKISKKN